MSSIIQHYLVMLDDFCAMLNCVIDTRVFKRIQPSSNILQHVTRCWLHHARKSFQSRKQKLDNVWWKVWTKSNYQHHPFLLVKVLQTCWTILYSRKRIILRRPRRPPCELGVTIILCVGTNPASNVQTRQKRTLSLTLK